MPEPDAFSFGFGAKPRRGLTAGFPLASAKVDDPLIKTLKLAHAIRRVWTVTTEVRDSLELVVLFGSASRGENRSESDVDVLVVATDVAAVLDSLAQHQWITLWERR